MGGKEEPARSVGRVGDGLARFQTYARRPRADQGARGVKCWLAPDLASSAFRSSGPSVDVALHVCSQHHPIGAVHHLDQAKQLGGIGDLVLPLGEDLARPASLLAKPAQKRNVVRFEVRAPAGGEVRLIQS